MPWIRRIRCNMGSPGKLKMARNGSFSAKHKPRVLQGCIPHAWCVYRHVILHAANEIINQPKIPLLPMVLCKLFQTSMKFLGRVEVWVMRNELASTRIRFAFAKLQRIFHCVSWWRDGREFQLPGWYPKTGRRHIRFTPQEVVMGHNKVRLAETWSMNASPLCQIHICRVAIGQGTVRIRKSDELFQSLQWRGTEPHSDMSCPLPACLSQAKLVQMDHPELSLNERK